MRQQPAAGDSAAPPLRVCLVCLGNICRSPMAEAVLRHQLREAGLDDVVEVASAGTGRWHLGGDADERTLAVLAEHGYPIRHRVRQFTAGWFDRYQLVIALDRGNRRELRALAPDRATADAVRLLRSYDPDLAAGPDRVAERDLDVPDPFFGDDDDLDSFEAVLRMVEAACRGLVVELGQQVRR